MRNLIKAFIRGRNILFQDLGNMSLFGILIKCLRASWIVISLVRLMERYCRLTLNIMTSENLLWSVKKASRSRKIESRPIDIHLSLLHIIIPNIYYYSLNTNLAKKSKLSYRFLINKYYIDTKIIQRYKRR